MFETTFWKVILSSFINAFLRSSFLEAILSSFINTLLRAVLSSLWGRIAFVSTCQWPHAREALCGGTPEVSENKILLRESKQLSPALSSDVGRECHHPSSHPHVCSAPLAIPKEEVAPHTGWPRFSAGQPEPTVQPRTCEIRCAELPLGVPPICSTAGPARARYSGLQGGVSQLVPGWHVVFANDPVAIASTFRRIHDRGWRKSKARGAFLASWLDGLRPSQIAKSQGHGGGNISVGGS